MKPRPRVLTKQAAVEKGENLCRIRHIPMSRTDILRVVIAKNPETGRPRYFFSKDIVSPRGGIGYVLVDMGDFEQRFLAAIKHYDANKPLMIRGKEIKEEELLDPGFDWGQLDEEDE